MYLDKPSPLAGIYDLYIDFPQQKITIFGWADPEKIIKAIKKTRKMATICNIEPNESPSQPAEEPSSQPKEPEQHEGNAQVLEATQPPQPTEAPPTQIGPPEETPKDTPPSEQSQPESAPSPTENNASQHSPSTPRTKDVGEVHVIQHHHPLPNYGNRFGSGHSNIGHWNRHQNGPVFQHELTQPVYVTHSYNTYRPSPYVTEYEYVMSPPMQHTHNNRVEHYSGDYYHNGNGNITSIFSDENPNACRIV